jgi:hypothetical protein
LCRSLFCVTFICFSSLLILSCSAIAIPACFMASLRLFLSWRLADFCSTYEDSLSDLSYTSCFRLISDFFSNISLLISSWIFVFDVRRSWFITRQKSEITE